MTWYAVAAVDDAVDAARGFLFPFSLVRWAKLAILVLFMGTGVSYDLQLPVAPTDVPVGERPTDVVPADGLGELPIGTDVLVAIAAVIVVVAVLLALVSLALRFVFYDALRTDDVRLWEPFRSRFGQAVRLFLFQFGLTLLVAGPLAAGAYVAVRRNAEVGAIGLTAGLVLGLAAGSVLLLLALVLRFTQEFVLPIMVLADVGPVAGWREFWPTLRDEWIQYLAYVLVHFFLALGIAVVQGVVLFVLAGVVVAIGAIAGLVVVGLVGGIEAALASVAGLAALAAIGLAVVGTLLVVLLPIRIVVTTYLICYELCVLGGTNPDFMLLSESIAADLDVLGDRGDPPDEGDSGRVSG